MAKKLGFKTISVFYQAITNERVNLSELRTLLSEPEQRENTEQRSAENYSHQTELERITSTASSDVLVIDQNLENINYSLAKCCNPIPGEKVLGFISINGGVTIHRANCNNVKALLKNYPYRIIEVKWNNESSAASEIVLKIVGDNEFGLLSTISNVIKDLHINILNANFETKESRFVGKLVLQVGNTNLLEQLLRKLKSLKGVSEVQRIS